MILTVIAPFIFFNGFLNMSRRVHAKMVFKLMHCQIDNFIERVPIGLIINRFSSDISVIDLYLPFQSYLILSNMAAAISVVLGILASNNIIIPIMGIMMSYYSYRVLGRYSYAQREVTRSYLITKSPILSQVIDKIKGQTLYR